MRIAPWVGLLILAIVFLAALQLGRRHQTPAPDLRRWEGLVDASAREFSLDPNLLRGLIAVESSGNPDAISRTGAIGLMQLMPATAKEQAERLRIKDYAEARLREPALNVRLGAFYLARLLKRFDGQESFALAAYNAGPSRVQRWRARAPDVGAAEVIEREGFAETRAHGKRALRFREAYRAEYGWGDASSGP